MFTRILVAALLGALSLGFAPMPFPKVKKKTGLTPEEIARRFNGTYRVVSYDMGNNGRIRGGLAIRNLFTEVVITYGTWTQTRDLGGRKIQQQYQMKIDASLPIPAVTQTYTGAMEPTFTGLIQHQGPQVIV